MCVDRYDRNPVMVAVFMGRVPMIRILNDELERRIEAQDPRIDEWLESYRKALSGVTAYHGRTPLHVAAVRYGQDSEMFKQVCVLCRSVEISVVGGFAVVFVSISGTQSVFPPVPPLRPPLLRRTAAHTFMVQRCVLWLPTDCSR